MEARTTTTTDRLRGMRAELEQFWDDYEDVLVVMEDFPMKAVVGTMRKTAARLESRRPELAWIENRVSGTPVRVPCRLSVDE